MKIDYPVSALAIGDELIFVGGGGGNGVTNGFQAIDLSQSRSIASVLFGDDEDCGISIPLIASNDSCCTSKTKDRRRQRKRINPSPQRHGTKFITPVIHVFCEIGIVDSPYNRPGKSSLLTIVRIQ
jgi:hypothetical protein